ncbi:MAG: KOW domain-containing RNA-binding protein [Clostridia bacterium]|nr:KOW domain-containing RNA-binding protein [Clostridia bacterium]
MIGQIVYARAGRDKGKFLVVVGQEERYLFVADGKERPLSRPKRKNPKHLSQTGTRLKPEQFLTDRALRRALAIYRHTEIMEEDE